MDYTVVVLTHADATFRDSSLSEYIASLPEVKPKDAETPSEGASSATDSNTESISMRKFLRDDVGEHVIAVNNKYRCEYERLKQRDALIDLIDVVQTKNNAKCFKNKYFDKAEKRLKLRRAEEEKARERLLEQEVAESHDAVNKARSLADHFSDAFLRNLQLTRVIKEIEAQFSDVTKFVERQIKELKEGIGIFLDLTELADSPLEDFMKGIVKATVVEAGKQILMKLEEEKIYEVVEEAAKRRQSQQKEEQKQKVKEEAVKWKPMEWYGMRKEKKAAKERHEKLKGEEMEQVRGHQNKMDEIRNNLREIEVEIGKKIKEDKAKVIDIIKRNGWDLQEFELALQYATQAVSLIAESNLKSIDAEDLQIKDAEDYIHVRNSVESQLNSHLAAMKETLEMMMIFEARIEASNPPYSNTVQRIIIEAINKEASLVVAEVTDETTQQELGNMRMEWQKKALQQAKDDKEINPRGQEVNIEQYERATNYARLWSLYVAEDNMRKMTSSEIENLRKEIVEEVFTEDLTKAITQVETNLKFQLEMAKKGKDTLKILAKIQIEDEKITVLNQLARDSLFDAVFFSSIENEKSISRKEILMNERRAHKLKSLTKVYVVYQNNRIETKGYELAQIFTAHAAEFLADRHMKYIRMEEIRKEDETNFKTGMAYVTEELCEELEKRDQAAVSYFKRFVTPEGKLSPLAKITRNSIQQLGRMMMLQPDNSLENRMKLEVLRDDWIRYIEQEKMEHETYLGELIDTLTACVRDLAPEYAKSMDISQLEQMKANGYKETIRELTLKVTGQLSDDAKTYFDEEKIGKSIAIYAELNEEFLRQLAKDVKCFPSEATVVEERRGEMKISDVGVGDRLLTLSPDGKLIFKDVFMLGKSSELRSIHKYHLNHRFS